MTEKEETELEKISGSVSETSTGDEEGVRRTSVTTFYSFKGNEVYHEVEDETGDEDSAPSQYRSV